MRDKKEFFDLAKEDGLADGEIVDLIGLPSQVVEAYRGLPVLSLIGNKILQGLLLFLVLMMMVGLRSISLNMEGLIGWHTFFSFVLAMTWLGLTKTQNKTARLDSWWGIPVVSVLVLTCLLSGLLYHQRLVVEDFYSMIAGRGRLFINGFLLAMELVLLGGLIYSLQRRSMGRFAYYNLACLMVVGVMGPLLDLGGDPRSTYLYVFYGLIPLGVYLLVYEGYQGLIRTLTKN